MTGYGGDDPIAALATAPGRSALAVIRLSGQNSLELLAPLFSRAPALLASPGGRVLHGWLLAPDRAPLDEVMIALYRAPRSYTGEDSAEISCHGGPAVTAAILQALREAGFRDALPGEFTFRAFMNGKADLTRAEAVLELTSAVTGQGRARAARRLAGSLAGEIAALRALLVQALAGVEICLDYAEEDGVAPEAGPLFPEEAAAREALGRLRALSASYRLERLYQEGALAVIAGRPNAGKSSLFNRLVKEDRAIVTAAPGTTRDWLEAFVSIDGCPARLVDTAGLRDAPPGAGPEAAPADEAEARGIARSLALISQADVILYVIDGEAGLSPEDRAFLSAPSPSGEVPVLAVWNKADKSPLQRASEAALSGEFPRCIWLQASALSGEGLSALTAALGRALASAFQGGPGGEASAEGPGTPRQKALLDGAAAAVEEALSLGEAGQPLDLIAPCLREAVDALGEITGETASPDILETMFSRFCVGK